MIERLAVVGFGQMGASLAAAWKLPTLAIDADAAVRRKALERGWAAGASERIADCASADAVLLAVPVRTAARILPEVVAAMRPGALLLDVASTKGAVVEAWRRTGAGVPYVSLHPLAGNEGAGIDSADPAVFRDAVFVVLPVAAPPESVEEAERLVRAAGGRPLRMDSPEAHDRNVAVTIHLPHVIAYALARTAGGTDLRLAGRSFRDSTRVALSDLAMVRDFLTTNAEATSRALGILIGELERFRDLLEHGETAALERAMGEGREVRRRV